LITAYHGTPALLASIRVDQPRRKRAAWHCVPVMFVDSTR
jgi:hypothetical protein